MVTAGSSDLDIPLETFSKVVEAIYDCAIDPNHWHNTIRQIAELVESKVCFLGVHDYTNASSELAFQWGYDEHYIRLHEEKYKYMDPFFHAGQLVPIGTVVTQAMLIEDEEFLEGQFYKEWVKPQGLLDMIAFKVLRTDRRVGWLCANRADTLPRYGPAEVHLMSLLSPHVCRAIVISDALNLKTIRSEALEATLDGLASGVYLTDRYSRIIYMNRAAERQVRAGNVLRVEHEHLSSVDRTVRVAMGNAIAQAIAEEAETPASGTTFALPDGEGGGLVATILPLTRGQRQNLCGAFAATVAIFVQDPVVVPLFPGEAFAKLYHLTGGELRVLLAMAPGLGVKEAADVLGIGETTAKTHLQHIYDKTGTSKQTELMHLFMSSAPPVSAA